MNDLATLVANAMKCPLVNSQCRPRCIYLRGNPKWMPLFPALEEIGIDVVIKTELPKVEEAIGEFLSQVEGAHTIKGVKVTAERAAVEKLFPAIAMYVRGHGYIEIGDQESFGFVVRAIGYGGVDFEDDTSKSLAEAMVVLEMGLAGWFEQQGVESE